MSSIALSVNKGKEDKAMTREEKIIELERMFKNCPEMLSPIKVSRWTPLGKNRVYELIKSKELKSFIYNCSKEEIKWQSGFIHSL